MKSDKWPTPLVVMNASEANGFRFPPVYPVTTPMGNAPLAWRDDKSGQLPEAVQTYFTFRIGEGPEPTSRQRLILAAYCAYHINAPCWDATCGENLAEELQALRLIAEKLLTIEDIADYTNQAIDIGLDPF